MTAALTILHVMDHVFSVAFPRSTWRSWVLCAAALFGLTHGLTPDDEAFIRQCLQTRELPTTQAQRAFLIVGRRGGKSRFAALLAVYLACFKTYTLAPGERGVGMVIAPDRRQARVIFRYIEALIDSVPMLSALVTSRTREAIHLSTGITIEVHTASFRSVRGYTIVFALIDEAAFLPTDDSAEPDAELMAALEPAMATVPDGLLLCVSSPYARRGELWRAYREHFGKPGSPFVWVADTRTMNPSVPQRVVDRAYADDPAVAASEYGTNGRVEFRRDIDSPFSLEAIEAARVPGRRELPPRSGVEYVAFIDPSGGSDDAMTLGIAHVEIRDEQSVGVLDLVREVIPPFSPESTAAAFAADLKRYGLGRVIGDAYGGEWPREAMRRHAIEYEVSARTKSDIYRELLPLLNSGRLELLDHPKLVAQLGHLERRTARGGRDVFDHGSNGHDDLINAASGALVLAAGEADGPPLMLYSTDPTGAYQQYYARGGTPDPEPDDEVITMSDEEWAA